MQWFNQTFNDINNTTLYDLLKARIDVFVVEQTCPYPELDDLDKHPEVRHIYALQDGQVAAYLRCLPPGLAYDEESAIGRVLTTELARGKGLGHELIKQGIAACEAAWPEHGIHMSAQEHLQSYYHQHGFKTVGEGYLEDDIPHIGMARAKKGAQ